MRILTTALLSVAASPAFAASGPFISLKNTDFVVLIAFLIFVGILLYFKVPSKVGEMLDSRANTIKAELDEAKALREEAQAAAEAAKGEIANSIARRLAGAEDKIASAQAAAVKDVRDRAVQVAVGAAKSVVAKQMDAKGANSLIDDAIATVGAKLH